MDPINRRHVWDVIEAAKQDRCVVLTTHSMEEADILGDRIGIMAKGRLRCLGNSVRLKSRFGEGYKVSISCGDGMRPDSSKSIELKKLFKEQLKALVAEENKSYMQFHLPNVNDGQLTNFFKELETRSRELGVQDVQLSMSTLEDVFLKVATASELEEAKKTNKIIIVTLKSGETAAVLLGYEDQLISEKGVTFAVKWGTDENGNLIPVDIAESSAVLQQVFVRCPAGSGPGQRVMILYEGRRFEFEVPEDVEVGQDFEVTIPVGPGVECEPEEVRVRCPAGVETGAVVNIEIDGNLYELDVPHAFEQDREFTAQIPVPKCEGSTMKHVSVSCPDGIAPGQVATVEVEGGLYQFVVPYGIAPGTPFDLLVAIPTGPMRLTHDELRERVEKLRTPFLRQAEALFRKNLQFQWKRRVTNSCLILVPALVLALIFGIQQAIDGLVLSSTNTRCPYCGPYDDYGRSYCMGSNDCPELFSPNSSWDTLLDMYGVDIVAQCKAMAGLGPNGTNDTNYCFGKGNLSCFQAKWATSSQAPFCPITGRDNILVQPPLGFAPLPAVRAKSSILYTSAPASAAFAQLIGNKTVLSRRTLRAKLLGAMRETNRQLYLLLFGLPQFGCRGSSLSIEQQQSLCRLMQHGSGSDADVCCLDFTGNSRSASSTGFIGAWQDEKFTGSLRSGVNYWSDTPELHNDSSYAAMMNKCKKTSTTGQCNHQIITQWQSFPVPDGRYGLRLGSGRGQYLASMEFSHVVGQLAQSLSSLLKNIATAEFNKILGAGESFTCVVPSYATEAAPRLPEDQCINIEAGLGVLAQASNFSFNLHPLTTYELSRVPDCTTQRTCTFTGINDPIIGTVRADSPGRWQQMCDFFTSGMSTKLRAFQSACSAEANCSQGSGNSVGSNSTSRSCNTSCPQTSSNQSEYLNRIPCLCKWIYFAQQLSAGSMFYIRAQTLSSYLKLPKQFSCSNSTDAVQDCSPRAQESTDFQPAALQTSQCWRKTYHALSLPELQVVTPVWPAANLRTENAITISTKDWWNVQHVISSNSNSSTGNTATGTGGGSSGSSSSTSTTAASASSTDCNALGTCWLQVGRDKGNLSFLADDCSLIMQESCFLQRMANLTGLSVGCISTRPSYLGSLSAINQAIYDGKYRSSQPSQAQEYVGAYDFKDSTPTYLRVTVLYNDTTQLVSGFNAPRFLRLSAPVNAVLDAFINAYNSPQSRITAALLGLKEVRSARSNQDFCGSCARRLRLI
jgi:hypothetical protein